MQRLAQVPLDHAIQQVHRTVWRPNSPSEAVGS
jgi:hypothetical protein